MTSSLIPILAAGGVFVIIMAIAVVLSRRAGNAQPQVGDRLSQFASRREEHSEKQKDVKPLAQIDAVVSKGKQGSEIARKLARADVKLTVAEFYGVKLLAAVVGVGVGWLPTRTLDILMYLGMIIGAILLSFVPDMYLGYAAGQRVKAFNNQLGDTITMMANALRSGSSFLQTLDLVSREAPNPTAGEFRRVVQEVSLGLTTEAALSNLLKRVPSDDLDLLITAVTIQMESGGNLAQILDTIGHTIRERVRIKGEIQVLTAQGRISAYVVAGLPIAISLAISAINPEYMKPMFTFGMPPDAWCCLPVTGSVMIIIGFIVTMKIVDIEV
ncbi:MAG: type II secretion system F family protein [Roseiflexaceae bacterium]